MKEEFFKLYNKWHSSFMFSAYGSADPRAKDSYEALKEWCMKNKEEALEYIRELLLEGPGDIVSILDELYNDNKAIVDGFCPLDQYCNLWLNILHKTKNVDYYKDYNAWYRHLDKEYIPWDPRIEEDPNVNLEEFKQGKRNPKGARKKKMTIRISKDYSWQMMMYESDFNSIRSGQYFTMPGDYEPEWETIEVTLEQLQDYINKGYAIKINC